MTAATPEGPRLAVAVEGGWAVLDGRDRGTRSVQSVVQWGRDGVENAVRAGAGVLNAVRPAAGGPCVPRPGKIICVRLNYHSHAAQAGMEIPDRPGVLLKLPSTLLPSGVPLRCPPIAYQYDYEGELALVVGRRAKNVPVRAALDYVWGYANCNDIHARDLHPFHFGKNLDGFLPVGPELVSADELGDPGDLAIRTWVNGDLRQDARTSDMIFDVAELISFISRYVTLDPGDLIATGTPAGPIVHRSSRDWMRPGDVVEVAVDGLGTLKTPLVAASVTEEESALC